MIEGLFIEKLEVYLLHKLDCFEILLIPEMEFICNRFRVKSTQILN